MAGLGDTGWEGVVSCVFRELSVLFANVRQLIVGAMETRLFGYLLCCAWVDGVASSFDILLCCT